MIFKVDIELLFLSNIRNCFIIWIHFLSFKNIHKLWAGFLFIVYLVIMLLPYNNAVYSPTRRVAFSGQDLARFEFLAAALMKNRVFGDVFPRWKLCISSFCTSLALSFLLSGGLTNMPDLQWEAKHHSWHARPWKFSDCWYEKSKNIFPSTWHNKSSVEDINYPSRSGYKNGI
jgi:hypothetical protein